MAHSAERGPERIPPSAPLICKAEYFGNTALLAGSAVSASVRSAIRPSNALPSRRVRFGVNRA